ncbi:MAG: histone deacetylase [Alphaproteobacteria bacterium]|jgi:acetoin utilization deacetylase AcuC-like enzyme|nr:histone deacetylase [Alphaproteobacteria bacterium]MDP6587858.1 histone deacetylase [Alphaproteobacteria bacterium]MDP6816620.1 histone deacetylase [Alphaproteobacteria bacterium]
MPPAIVFHPDYTVPLPPGHRFPIGKFGRIKELLLADAVIGHAALRRPEPVTEDELCRAHDPDYVATILGLTLDKKSERRLGLPLSAALVRRGRAAVGGTLLTARLALEDGLACNIAGGSHHAFPGHGAGFCIFNDVAVTIEVLRRDQALRTALVIDCDVHQGDGTAAFFRDAPDIFTFSLHCEANYPPTKEVSDLDIGVPAGTGDDVYLSVVESHVGPLLDSHRPDIVFYNAGVDPHVDDKLGKLALSDAGLRARDDHVMECCMRRGAALACVVGGGYADDLDVLARRHGILHRAATAAAAAAARESGKMRQRQQGRAI